MMSQSKNPKNARTALILTAFVLLFFFGIIAKRVWFS
ncbi:MAG TPA: cytochrome oxidase small assembly protein [Herbaspirillum sp.]